MSGDGGLRCDKAGPVPGDLYILCLRWIKWNYPSRTPTIHSVRIAFIAYLIAIHKSDAIFWECSQHHLQLRGVAFQVYQNIAIVPG